MAIPVLIPARNEASGIAITIDSFTQQADSVEPIVIINDCVDNTANVALSHGATVLISEEAGKTRALQTGLRWLGERALGPVILLDADTRPIFRHWSAAMTSPMHELPEDRPAIGWGPLRFDGPDGLSGLLRTMRSYQLLAADRNRPHRVTNGANMVLALRDEVALAAMLQLENYWEYGDHAMHDLVIAMGGVKKHILSPLAAVRTDGTRFPSLYQRLTQDRTERNRAMDEDYHSEAAPGTVAYKPLG